MSIKQATNLRDKLQTSLDKLIGLIGKICIGTKEQFPYGWGNAAKGRTVWRILEEVIIQNIKKNKEVINIRQITPSDSEVSIHDFVVELDEEPSAIYVNVKSAVLEKKTQKDDISKGTGLLKFYENDVKRPFFIATFFIKFNDDMTIEIDKCIVFPVAWIPDVYVNPSNNGNLQSSKYKDLSTATKRSNKKFLEILKKEIERAHKKKRQKAKNSKKRKKKVRKRKN